MPKSTFFLLTDKKIWTLYNSVSENTYRTTFRVLPHHWHDSSFAIVVNRLPYLMHLNLRTYDLTCLHKARELLIKDLQKKHSIPELASRVAINEYKLKHGFRQVFGMPVITFLRIERLKRAKTLLEETDLNETAISKAVGFKNVGSFINAFKKKYSCLPHTIRKQ
jgi:AraC-like DNA-binding protein